MQGIAAVAATLGLSPDLCEWRGLRVSGGVRRSGLAEAVGGHALEGHAKQVCVVASAAFGDQTFLSCICTLCLHSDQPRHFKATSHKCFQCLPAGMVKSRQHKQAEYAHSRLQSLLPPGHTSCRCYAFASGRS